MDIESIKSEIVTNVYHIESEKKLISTSMINIMRFSTALREMDLEF